MKSFAFDFHGLELQARASGALWWAEGAMLVVSDLHLGKSERMARRGGALLPPYESRATLERLAREMDALSPRHVISLGDGFDDNAAAEALDDDIGGLLSALAKGVDWVWITGNHDPVAPGQHLPGRSLTALQIGDVILRHEAMPNERPDISGHFHPVVRLAGTRMRAFLIDACHLLMPAFGTYTGGLINNDDAIARIFTKGIAVASCGNRVYPFPYGHKNQLRY